MVVGSCLVDRIGRSTDDAPPRRDATGPSREAMMRVHERAGHPTAEGYELPIEVS
jgi:hypothetical protein